MTRWKASLIHLSISAAIASTVAAIMLLLWYPHPLFEAVGGQKILLILLGVDMTLGPLITLTIFNPKKSRKELTFDLSVIAAFQLAALIYGMNVVIHARPVYMVFSRDSFDLVTANMLSKEDMAKVKHPDFRTLPLTGPVYAYTELPTDTKERSELALGVLSGKDLPQFPQFYQPYADHTAAAGRVAKPIAELKRLNPAHVREIDDAVHDSGRTEMNLAYLPMRAPEKDLAVLIGKNDGRALKILDLVPW